MSDVIAAFSAEQVSQLTGLSVNQLRKWDIDEFFVPSLASDDRSEAFSRVYTFEDVVGLRTLSMLRKDYKVSRQHLRKAANKLKQHSGKPWSRLTFYVFNREVHFKNPTTGHVEGAVTGQLAVPIRLASVAEDMRVRAEALKRRDPSSIGKWEQKRHTMRGVPVVKGTRIPISTIKSFAEAGYTPQQIIAQYPSLNEEDVVAALEFDSDLTRAA